MNAYRQSITHETYGNLTITPDIERYYPLYPYTFVVQSGGLVLDGEETDYRACVIITNNGDILPYGQIGTSYEWDIRKHIGSHSWRYLPLVQANRVVMAFYEAAVDFSYGETFERFRKEEFLPFIEQQIQDVNEKAALECRHIRESAVKQENRVKRHALQEIEHLRRIATQG